MAKKFFVSILLVCIFSCSAYADLVYTTSNGIMGFIKIYSSSDVLLSVDKPVKTYSDADEDSIVTHFYNEDGTSFVALIEHETDPAISSGDSLYIFNASDLKNPTNEEAIILTGVYNTNSTAYSGNHRSIYFASGIKGKATLTEFNTSNFELARRFSYVTSDDETRMKSVLVNGASVLSLATHTTSMDSLFFRFDGQIDSSVKGSWSTKAYYDSELMTFGGSGQVLLAHSTGVDQLSGGNFTSIISTDNPVKALCRDKENNGFYFITLSEDTGTQILTHYKNGTDGIEKSELDSGESDSMICKAIYYTSGNKTFVAVIMNDEIAIYDSEDDTCAAKFTSSELGGIPISITGITQNTSSSSDSSSKSNGCNITGAGILLIISAGCMLTRKRKI